MQKDKKRSEIEFTRINIINLSKIIKKNVQYIPELLSYRSTQTDKQIDEIPNDVNTLQELLERYAELKSDMKKEMRR